LQTWKPGRLPLAVQVFMISAHSSTGAFGSQNRTGDRPGIGLVLHEVAHCTER
jgi:hypothetical protein